MGDEVLDLERIVALGNEGAPQEWLDCLTGEGTGGGLEGVGLDDAGIAALAEEARASEGFPRLPVEATPEISYYGCSPANLTRGRQGARAGYIVVHYTAGASTAEGAALANCRYFSNGSRGASAHYFIDSGYTIWQSVSESDTAWHAGNWNMNVRSIGIEVCTAGAYTEAEIERLSWLVRRLMAKYSIPASRVIRHYDVTGKLCPAHYVDAARWAALHARIAGGSAPSEPSTGQMGRVTATYALRVEGGGWWPDVTDFNNSDSDGYAGAPYTRHDAFRATVDKGGIRYRVMGSDGSWGPWARDGEVASTDVVCGVQAYFETPGGCGYQQAYYRSQTTERAGYLPVCCDDGIMGFDSWAGWPGEPMDRLQLAVRQSNPF